MSETPRKQPTGKQVGWMQGFKQMDHQYVWGSEKPVRSFWNGELGSRMMTSYPIYDNGRYYVIDTQLDLVFTIISWENGNPMREVRLDKYEAIRIADELFDADVRYESLQRSDEVRP